MNWILRIRLIVGHERESNYHSLLLVYRVHIKFEHLCKFVLQYLYLHRIISLIISSILLSSRVCVCLCDLFSPSQSHQWEVLNQSLPPLWTTYGQLLLEWVG